MPLENAIGRHQQPKPFSNQMYMCMCYIQPGKQYVAVKRNRLNDHQPKYLPLPLQATYICKTFLLICTRMTLVTLTLRAFKLHISAKSLLSMHLNKN
jgi:hypothetical protein